MPAKITLNRASVRMDEFLVRQINGNTQNTKRLLKKFEKSGIPEQLGRQVNDKLNQVHKAIMAVFEGSEGVSLTSVSSVQGVDLSKPWQPLSWAYMRRKKFDAFWREEGTLLEYVAKALAPISGSNAVRRVEVKAGKVPRGAKTVRASVLVTPARLPEPLQSLVMYPFLQGKGNSLVAMGASDVQAKKLLVNHALRGFMPDIAAEFGTQLLDELKS